MINRTTGEIIKKLVKILIVIFLGLLSIPAVGFIILQNKKIQTYLTKEIMRQVSEELNTEFKIDATDIVFFNRIIFINALLKDQKGDTLLSADKIVATLKSFSTSTNRIRLNRIRLEHAQFLVSIDSLNVVNLDFIIERFLQKPDSLKNNWSIEVRDIEMADSKFILKIYDNSKFVGPGVDLNNIVLSDLDIKLNDMEIGNDTIRFDIKHLDFIDKSGFEAREVYGKMAIHQTFLDFKNLYIETPTSRIFAPVINFSFKNWQEFADNGIMSRIKMTYQIDPSRVDLYDVGYFVPFFWGMRQDVGFSGKVYGRVNNFKARDITLEYMDHLHFTGDFDMNGLPDWKQTFMFFNIQDLSADIEKMKAIEIPGRNGHPFEFSETLLKLRQIQFTGKFTGFPNDFVTYGRFNTGLGKISSDLSIRPDTANMVSFSGRLKTSGFNLGQLAGTEKTFGLVSMNGQVKGVSSSDGTVNARMDGFISLIQINSYDYQNITLAGNLTNKTFDGSFAVEDPNLRMNFFGKIDAAGEIPVFDFTANVDRARLYPLNIIHSDPTYTLSCLLKANFVGANLDDFNGDIKLVNSLFQREDKQIQIYDFNFHALNRPDSSSMVLNSDLIDAELTGLYNFKSIGKVTWEMLDNWFPALPYENVENKDLSGTDNNDFNFSFNFKNTFPITDFFFPDVEIAKNSKLVGTYSPGKKFVDITGNFPYLRYKNYKWNEFLIFLNSNDSIIDFESNTANMEFGEKINLENFGIRAQAKNNEADFAILWNNWGTKLYKGNISIHSYLRSRENSRIPLIELAFDPGSIVLGDTTWQIRRSNSIIDTSAITLNKFYLVHNEQYIYIDGKLSQDPSDIITLTFHDVNLSNLNEFTNTIGLDIDGVIEGTANLSNIYDRPVFLSNLQVNNLAINNEILGNTVITSSWDNSEEKIHVDAYSNRGELKTLQVKGDYRPANRGFDIRFDLDKLRLDIIYPYLKDYLDDISGIVSGKLDLTGDFERPVMNGDLKLQKVSFMISYLKTRYSFSNDLQIKNNNIRFRDFKIYDDQGSLALMNGSITNTWLRDFYFDLNFDTKNFYFLNTREADNEMYYGRAIGTGIINIKGMLDEINMNISARTEKNTELYININAGEDITESTFITFKSTGRSQKEIFEDNQREVTGLNMNFDLEVTPDAEVQIVFDPKVGDIIKGKGSGNINLQISSEGEFLMFGNFEIESGEYLFTLQNIINKRLKVEKGGIISWNGDPIDATIDMSAIYSTKAIPSVLVPDPPPYLKDKRYPVDCKLIMTDKMMNPNIKFEITLPTAEEETKNFVKNAITTQEELTKQFISLLVINNFSSSQSIASPGTVTSQGTGMAGVTTSELLSNQLSNWLSQISNDFDIGVNYRPGDEITTDQLEVALSTQILDERVIIHTNLDVGGSQTTATQEGTSTKNITGEFDVNVKLTNDGKLSLKAYNHSNDDQLYNTSQYTQGVGFIYREDFNSFGELIKKYWTAIFPGDKRKDRKKGSNSETGPVSDMNHN
jgi:hypothetical protein